MLPEEWSWCWGHEDSDDCETFIGRIWWISWGWGTWTLFVAKDWILLSIWTASSHKLSLSKLTLHFHQKGSEGILGLFKVTSNCTKTSTRHQPSIHQLHVDNFKLYHYYPGWVGGDKNNRDKLGQRQSQTPFSSASWVQKDFTSKKVLGPKNFNSK